MSKENVQSVGELKSASAELESASAKLKSCEDAIKIRAGIY